MTQTAEILAALRQLGEAGLTPLDALAWYGCFRLGARIHEIKADLSPEEEIVNVWYTAPGGARVARYVLRHREPAQLAMEL